MTSDAKGEYVKVRGPFFSLKDGTTWMRTSKLVQIATHSHGELTTLRAYLNCYFEGLDYSQHAFKSIAERDAALDELLDLLDPPVPSLGPYRSAADPIIRTYECGMCEGRGYVPTRPADNAGVTSEQCPQCRGHGSMMELK